MRLQERGVESNIQEPVIEALNDSWCQRQEHHHCGDSREPEISDGKIPSAKEIVPSDDGESRDQGKGGRV